MGAKCCACTSPAGVFAQLTFTNQSTIVVHRSAHTSASKVVPASSTEDLVEGCCLGILLCMLHANLYIIAAVLRLLHLPLLWQYYVLPAVRSVCQRSPLLPKLFAPAAAAAALVEALLRAQPGCCVAGGDMRLFTLLNMLRAAR
jgi:hypothetical protein